MRKALIIALPALLLAGCATTQEPQVEYRTVEVKVPVVVPCVPKSLPRKPQYTVTRESLLALPGADQRYRDAVVGLLERDARLAEIEPVIEECRR